MLLGASISFKAIIESRPMLLAGIAITVVSDLLRLVRVVAEQGRIISMSSPPSE
jgi:hypothetical protein